MSHTFYQRGGKKRIQPQVEKKPSVAVKKEQVKKKEVKRSEPSEDWPISTAIIIACLTIVVIYGNYVGVVADAKREAEREEIRARTTYIPENQYGRRKPSFVFTLNKGEKSHMIDIPMFARVGTWSNKFPYKIVYDNGQVINVENINDDKRLVDIPYYAIDLDNNGNKIWRSVIDKGFVDNTTNLGVDYPFLNGKHYLYNNHQLFMKIQNPNSDMFKNIKWGDFDILSHNMNNKNLNDICK